MRKKVSKYGVLFLVRIFCIQSKNGKIRNIKISVFGDFSYSVKTIENHKDDKGKVTAILIIFMKIRGSSFRANYALINEL